MIDEHKLLYHPTRVAEWLANGDCFPIYVEIGLTNRCNQRCIFCALDWLGQKAVDIDKKVMLNVLKDMATNGVKSIMFAGEGESLLHKDAPLFIRSVADMGIKVAVTTNGVPFTPQKAEECLPHLSWIRFSINAGNPRQYELVHRGKATDFELVLANIRFAAEFKKENHLKVDIGVQTLLLPESIDGIRDLAMLVKDAGADNLQIKPYSHHPSSDNCFTIDNVAYLDLEPSLRAFESDVFKIFFRKKTIQRIVDGADYNFCHGLPFIALVNAYGQVVPCNLFYSTPEFIFGDLHKESFADIWRGEQRKQVLLAIKAREMKSCRQGCRLDPINRYLHRILFPEERDVFI
jgi:MoaA/NifB/PqqE/SkfB family radical SAM enzyme